MTYTYKLSRRLARLRAAAVLASCLLAVASCAPGEPIESGLAPPPTGEVSAVLLAPDSVTLAFNASATFVARGRQSDGSVVGGIPVTWEATGGSVSQVGVYTAGTSAGAFRVIATHASGLADTAAVVVAAPTLVGLTVSPGVVSLPAGQSQGFAAVASYSDGSSQNNAVVSWSATGGSISSNGTYTAGNTAGNFRVIGSLSGQADTSTVTVTVTAATVASISLTPSSVSLQSAQTQQFAVSATMSDGSTQTNPAVTWSATGGTVVAGLYTAGGTAGSFRVIATSTNGHADTSTVTVTVPAATVASITLTPSSVSLQSAQTQQFAVSATMSDGSTQNNSAVTWSATGGTVSTGGLYTAGGTAGSFRVIATSTNGHADTSTVTVTVPAATVASISLTPSSVSLQSAQTQQFAVSATMSDGSTQTNPAVTWSATGGTVVAGLYTAGGTAGSFRVIATSTNGHADTSTVTVTVPAATVASITLTPSSVSLQSAQTQQFAVSATMSDGSTQNNSAVTWSATGGTVSTGGLYTAGGTAGSFRVIATSTNGHADTSTVTVTVPAATAASISLTPSSVSLQSAQTQQFAVSATMSDGSTQTNPAVTWSATGGTVSTGGLYTAGGTAGTFRVIAITSNGRADTSTVNLTIPAATITALVLTPGSVTLQSSQTQQYAVSATMSDGSTQNNPTVTWSATGGSMSGSAMYTAGSTTGSYRVIATASGKADTSTVTISAPSSGPGYRQHEPAGYTTIADQGFSSLTAAGWIVESGSPSIVSDATGTASPGSVVRASYGSGYRAGAAPWTMERTLPGTTKLYISLTYRLSSNFQGEDSGTNKMGFVWIHNNPSVFFSNEGTGSGTLHATMRLQGTADSREYLSPNVGNGAVSRGVWHTWEVELISNSSGGANGTVRWWFDGVLLGQYTDVKMSSSGQGRTFDLERLSHLGWG